MNPGGLFLVIAGVWVLAQTFPGHALQRLNILESDKPDATPGDLFGSLAGDFGKAAGHEATQLPGQIFGGIWSKVSGLAIDPKKLLPKQPGS